MPGYRALSSSVIGSAADSAREAEHLRREGDPRTAVALLEEALDAARHLAPEMPGWLCGRLAAMYRTVGRYDDEVSLLERYRESQSSDEARSRYDARLSKARTIAERKRRSDSGALSSVRKVLRTPRRRSAASRAGVPASRAGVLAIIGPSPAGGEHIVPVRAVLGEPASAGLDARLSSAVTRYAGLARASGMSMEQSVDGLRAASRSTVTAQLTNEERDARYSAALVSLLAAYFNEGER